jgi:protoporphyrinogen oxidase
MNVAVIGAGPAGMTAAYQLTKAGAHVEVFESDGAVGGMARSIELWDQTVDLGPHRFFSTDPRVNGLWSEVIGDDSRIVDRLTRIYYQKRLFHYPLQATNALWNMGLWQATRCVASYLKETIRPSATLNGDDDFETWVVSRFGRRLFEMFFKSYSEKLWGLSCRDLDADFAAQRIKGFSLGEAIRSTLGFGAQRHKTLVDQFAYPTGGSGMFYQRMADFVRQNGGRIHLRCPVQRVLHRQGQIVGIQLANRELRSVDQVISSMPLTELVAGLGEPPAPVQHAVDSLSYRNTILVYLLVDGTELFPDQWLYIHSPQLQTGRITNFRNWAAELCGSARTSILVLEYWCNDDDALWRQSHEDLVALGASEMGQTGLLRGAAILDGHVVRLARSYPVYRRGYREHVKVLANYLASFQGLTAIGRYGTFKYNNQDHSVLMGMLAAENLLGPSQHSLWSINTDYESYQEAGSAAQLQRAA